MKLIKNNTPFVCISCKREVIKARGNSRDHCPFCLCSLHVDLYVPGDRKNDCHGIMRAVGIRNWKSEQYKILFRCEICSGETWNITAEDDSMEAITEVMQKTNSSQLGLN